MSESATIFASQKLGQIEAELINSTVMNPTDRQMLVGAAALESPVLFEGAPGLGKTKIANAIAAILGGNFKRVQFTPDLRPQDITGSEIWNPETGKFDFVPGPVFTNVLLADEFNRSLPKTLSALLEVMQERQVTIGRTTHKLPKPFFVVATENPQKPEEGTTNVPLGTLDRIGLRIGFDEQSVDTMLDVVNKQDAEAKRVIDEPGELLQIQDGILEVAIDEDVMRWTAQRIVDLRAEAEVDTDNSVISGTRALLQAIQHAKAQAIMGKSSKVTHEDIQKVVPYVLGHRVNLTHEAVEDNHLTTRQVVASVFKR